MSLQGKTALVTGGAVRIGRAIALALAGRGVRIALHYGASAAEAAATVAEIRSLGVDAEGVQADLRRVEGLDRLVGGAAARFGGLDFLVNSAAVFLPGGVAETTPELWEEQFAINLRAPFFLCRAFAREASAEGAIVNIADRRVVRPRADYFAYTLTKSAIVTMTEALAVALAPAVRVNAVAPGAILPPPGRDAAYLAQLAAGIPLGRSGSPEDVCSAVIYLLEAGFVTGQTLFVDGGERL